ncbi:MAG: hypothetical protein PHV36_02625 [Elusimicrobiales bacterium]|nr:hypothetical protein [Elusimicrobiales bacterium]
MNPGFKVFPEFSGKVRELLRKKPLETLFIFAALAAAAAVISSYKANASDISLEITGRDATLRLIQVYGVSSKGVLSELDRRDGTWGLDKGNYVKKLLIALPKNGLPDITAVSVRVGKRLFEFSAADFLKFEVLRLGAVQNTEWDIYELPWIVKDHKSLSPNFSAINWRGDASFCFGAALRFSLFCILFLALLSLLDPAYFTGRHAREKAAGRTAPEKGGSFFSRLSEKNRTVWTFEPAWRSRDLNLGRPFHLALVFLLTAGVVGAISVLQVDPHHDGIMLKPAFDVASGQTLFRDTFTQYGALTTWVQALALKVFGGSLLVLRLLTAFTYGLIAVLMWLLFSRFLPNYLNTFTCLSWLFLGYFFVNYPSMMIMPWSTAFAVCSALFSLYLLVRFLEHGRLPVLFASGFAAALTFWFKINYGVVSFLAAIVFLAVLLAREERGRAARVLAAFTGGHFTAHALFAGWLAVHGSLRDFTLQSVKLALAFSGYNAFSTSETTAVRLVKSLLQVDSPHGGISYLWLVLPLVSCGVFFHSARAVAFKKNASVKTKTVLAVSSASLALWLGYYPIPSLFHMYPSSVLFFGLLSYLVLAAASRLGFAGNRLLVLAILGMIFLPDFAYRTSSFMRKVAWVSSWERIESPDFLRGMYVPGPEKKAFAEIGTLIARSPGRLINLTNSALYSLYKTGGPNFHKMYMDWGWANSFLYPDYVQAVARQIRTGEGSIISNDIFMVPGYVPVRVFAAFVGGEVINKPLVLLLPGQRTGGFKFTGADKVLRPRTYDRFPLGYRFRLKTGGATVVVESVVIKILSKATVHDRLPRYEYEYELLPRLFDPAAAALVGKAYILDRPRNEYRLAVPLEGKAGVELMAAISGAFLYEKSSFLADTFPDSKNPNIYLYRNGKAVGFGPLFDGAPYKAGDTLDLVVPAVTIPDDYAARIRINFKGGKYQEEKILVYRR